MCEESVLSINNKQPMSIYSKIYPFKSKYFISKKYIYLRKYKSSRKFDWRKFIGVFERGYEDNKIFKYMSKNEPQFVIRLDDERTLLFKGKKRSVGELAKTRKGEYHIKHCLMIMKNMNLCYPTRKQDYQQIKKNIH